MAPSSGVRIFCNISFAYENLTDNHLLTGQVLPHKDSFLHIAMIIETISLFNMFKIIFRQGKERASCERSHT